MVTSYWRHWLWQQLLMLERWYPGLASSYPRSQEWPVHLNKANMMKCHYEQHYGFRVCFLCVFFNTFTHKMLSIIKNQRIHDNFNIFTQVNKSFHLDLCHHPWRHDACYASLLWIWVILWIYDGFEHKKWKIKVKHLS